MKIGYSILIGLLFLGLLSRLSGAFLVEWIVLGMTALLLHELGHAVAFRHYGISSSISFWGLGGFTTPDDAEAALRMPDRQMVVVALAGPAVGLVIGVASLAVGLAVQDSSSAVRVPVALWIFVNLVWAVFNLLPIASLDGGRALRHLAGAIFPGRFGVVLGLTANLAASAILAVLAVEAGQLYIAFIAVVFGLASPDIYGMLLDALWPGRVKRRRDEDAAQIEQAREANERRAIEAGRYGEPHESIYQGDQGDSPWRRP